MISIGLQTEGKSCPSDSLCCDYAHHPFMIKKEPGGLHCSLLQENLKSKISQGLQIVYSHGDHWIVASTLDHDSSDVMVFDSIYTSVDKGTQVVIQNLFALSVQSVIKSMQKQRGGDDCGLFAVATATALAFGIDPAELTFQQDAMRVHVNGSQLYKQNMQQELRSKCSGCLRQLRREYMCWSALRKVWWHCFQPHNNYYNYMTWIHLLLFCIPPGITILYCLCIHYYCYYYYF